MSDPKIAIIIPCYNEDLTINKVISDFQQVVPHATIYVFDNNSTDNTYEYAKQSGVTIYKSPYQGKGNVIRHAFAVVDADVYIIADGDDQCDTSVIPEGIQKFLDEDLDMLSFVRVAEHEKVYRTGHAFGNKMLTNLVKLFFKNKAADILGGYRIFSKAFVKSFPAHSRGFEIEIELSIFAHQMRLLTAEMEVPYRKRPEGSFSKLNTITDGILILSTIIYLIITEKPLLFFGTIFGVLGSLATFWIVDVYLEFLQIMSVPRFPTLIFALILLSLASLSLSVGIILTFLQRNTMEQKRYMYLQYKNRSV